MLLKLDLMTRRELSQLFSILEECLRVASTACDAATGETAGAATASAGSSMSRASHGGPAFLRAPSDDEARAVLAQARGHYLEGQLSTALDVSRHCNCPDGHLLRASALFLLGRNSDLVLELRRALGSLEHIEEENGGLVLTFQLLVSILEFARSSIPSGASPSEILPNGPEAWADLASTVADRVPSFPTSGCHQLRLLFEVLDLAIKVLAQDWYGCLSAYDALVTRRELYPQLASLYVSRAACRWNVGDEHQAIVDLEHGLFALRACSVPLLSGRVGTVLSAFYTFLGMDNAARESIRVSHFGSLERSTRDALQEHGKQLLETIRSTSLLPTC